MTEYRCLHCSATYPASGLPTICPICGGMFGLTNLTYSLPKDNRHGIWRFRDSFGLPEINREIYLGEGRTPLVRAEGFGEGVFMKCEHLNPSGSFKDRGTAILSSLVITRGIQEVVEDSSGNAGASLALYSQAAGFWSNIFVPASTSGPKLKQIMATGVKVIKVEGPREAAHQAVEMTISDGTKSYASHAYLPFHLAGYATILFEIYEQLGRIPGTIIAPIGHGSLFLGLVTAGECLETANLGDRPKYIGVQPANCAPVFAEYYGDTFKGTQGRSLAEGTQVSQPARMMEILAMLNKEVDELVKIPEEEILLSHQQIIRNGFYVEPTSAMVLAALKKTNGDLPSPIVLILTGSGLKFTP